MVRTAAMGYNNLMASLRERVMAAITAFKRGYVTPATDSLETDFVTFDGRRMRYSIYWSLYAQDAYDSVHNWAQSYKTQYALYRYIRNLYSPAYRLGEFYKSHLMGGQLDHSAGPIGAIPIDADSERVRGAIAELWKWSNWSVKKDVFTLWGSVLGDVGLAVVDDIEHGKVRLEVVRPGIIKSVVLDDFGNVKEYSIEYETYHPERPSTKVTYTEQVYREGELVVYETFLNGAPYAWNEVGSSWQEPYGFVPFVLVKHNDVGLDWGWSEFQPLSGKMREADDIASRVSDHIRKSVDPLWLMTGMKPSTLSVSGDDPTADRPQPGREELRALWVKDGEAKPLVSELSLEDSLAHLNGLIKEIERDYPELGLMVATASGDASGRALRVARQPAVAKVLQRRPNYDDGLVRAQQMALAIGGWRGYDGYSGFGLDSYGRGELDHQISERPVFEDDPLDIAEVSEAEWTAAKAAVEAGVPLSGYLLETGWSEERIARLIGENEQLSETGMQSATAE